MLFKSSRILDQTKSKAYYNKGNALNELKRYQEAIEYFSKAIELDPTKSKVYSNKRNSLLGLERFEEAIQKQ